MPNPKESDAAASHQSVERAFAVLNLLANGPLRVGEIAEALDLGQSTTSRLLLTLERSGFVTREQKIGGYGLGPSILRLGGAAANQSRIHRVSRVLAQSLAHEHGAIVSVAVRVENQIQYIVSLQGGGQVKPITMLGQFNPLHATALGKSLLLGVDRDTAVELAQPLTRLTVNTITTAEELIEQLDRAADTGYTVEIEELALGRACIAAPIRDADGSIVAAVSVAGSLRFLQPATREREWGDIAIEAADTISSHLGYIADGSMGV